MILDKMTCKQCDVLRLVVFFFSFPVLFVPPFLFFFLTKDSCFTFTYTKKKHYLLHLFFFLPSVLNSFFLFLFILFYFVLYCFV